MPKTCSICRHPYDGDICMSELCIKLRHQRRKQVPAPPPPPPMAPPPPPPPMDVPPAPDLMGPPAPPMGGGRRRGGQKVKVPNVVGLSDENAKAALEAVGLVPEFKNTHYSLTLEPEVLRQDPAANAELAKGKKVTLGAIIRSQEDDGETEENKSSSVPREQMDAFVGALADSTNPDLGFPAFTLSDCNSFHTTGYLWGLYAAKRLKKLDLPAGPIAAINFDQHDDSGVLHGTFVASDRWGRPLVSALRKLGFPACYLSVLNGRDASQSGFFAAGGSDEQPRLSSDLTAENVKDFWKSVRNYFGQPVKYVFVTVDRDCLKNCFNQWGDGGVANVEDLIAKMRIVLGPLLVAGAHPRIGVRRGGENQADTPPPAKLIGFDVTGMPEHQLLLEKYRPKMLTDNLDIRTPKGGQTLQDFAEAHDVTVDVLAGLNPPAVLQYWDPADPPPAVIGHKQNFNAMLTGAWSGAKIGDLFELAEELPILDDQEWSKALFFSGSVGYGSGHTDFGENGGLSTHDRWDYVSNISRRLSDLLEDDWKYVLCAQEAPMYKQGWKAFEVFAPGAAVSDCADGPAAKEVLGAVKSRPGGFSCTASLTDPNQPKAWGWGDSVKIHHMLDTTDDFAK